MRQRIALLSVAAVGLATIAGCGGKREGAEAFVVVGADTVAIDSLAGLMPGSAGGRAVAAKMALQVLLARRSAGSGDTAEVASTARELSETLSLRTGREWSVPAASSVFGAARALRSVVSDADSAATATYLDSLHSSIHGLGDSLGRAPLPSSSLFADTGAAHRMELLATLLRSQLGHTPTAAALVAEFAMADGRALRDSIDMAGVVRGLVRDSTGPGRESVARRPAASRRRRPDNSALALKFRDSQSIKDSIGKHTPNLQALYKRELKRHAGMSGTVYVTFRVAPSGKVLSATIKSTQIEEKDFLVPFIEYAGTMRFKPIPEHVGPMTFEFPFSFTPKS